MAPSVSARRREAVAPAKQLARAATAVAALASHGAVGSDLSTAAASAGARCRQALRVAEGGSDLDRAMLCRASEFPRECESARAMLGPLPWAPDVVAQVCSEWPYRRMEATLDEAMKLKPATKKLDKKAMDTVLEEKKEYDRLDKKEQESILRAFLPQLAGLVPITRAPTTSSRRPSATLATPVHPALPMMPAAGESPAPLTSQVPHALPATPVPAAGETSAPLARPTAAAPTETSESDDTSAQAEAEQVTNTAETNEAMESDDTSVEAESKETTKTVLTEEATDAADSSVEAESKKHTKTAVTEEVAESADSSEKAESKESTKAAVTQEAAESADSSVKAESTKAAATEEAAESADSSEKAESKESTKAAVTGEATVLWTIRSSPVGSGNSSSIMSQGVAGLCCVVAVSAVALGMVARFVVRRHRLQGMSALASEDCMEDGLLTNVPPEDASDSPTRGLLE